ncbi:MAG: CBS domain-containing protein, partial [Clostridia bacterium]|nr:CBS domain-containing protein [Clostridia bacterium]
LPSIVEGCDMEFLNLTCVQSVMQDQVISVTEDTTVLEAAQLMVNKKIGCLPVIREDKIIGLFIERNAIRGLISIAGSSEK